MAVGFSVDFYWYQVGHGEFLHSFFSTIAYNLESAEWGSKYPLLMNHLYQGKLEASEVSDALAEVREIQLKLKEYEPDKVVWDIEDLSVQPPWGSDISEDITDLSNYFVTSDGEDLITLLLHALEKAKELNLPIEIESI